MRVLRKFACGAPIIAAALLVSCGSSITPTANATTTSTVSTTPSETATATSEPPTTAGATVAELSAVASLVYPACTPDNCAGNAMFTTCAAGASGVDVFASCRLTPRLLAQLKLDISGIPSAADPLGGGQDPEWTTKTVTATPSATGGVAHVVLGFGPGTRIESIDLEIVGQDGQLLVDDISCTGTDPAGADAYAAGWLDRSVCSS